MKIPANSSRTITVETPSLPQKLATLFEQQMTLYGEIRNRTLAEVQKANPVNRRFSFHAEVRYAMNQCKKLEQLC